MADIATSCGVTPMTIYRAGCWALRLLGAEQATYYRSRLRAAS
ncbi:MAG: hypothetical protein ACRDRQ_06465 [Pseudonocardiaceae bacterium]